MTTLFAANIFENNFDNVGSHENDAHHNQFNLAPDDNFSESISSPQTPLFMAQATSKSLFDALSKDAQNFITNASSTLERHDRQENRRVPGVHGHEARNLDKAIKRSFKKLNRHDENAVKNYLTQSVPILRNEMEQIKQESAELRNILSSPENTALLESLKNDNMPAGALYIWDTMYRTHDDRPGVIANIINQNEKIDLNYSQAIRDGVIENNDAAKAKLLSDAKTFINTIAPQAISYAKIAQQIDDLNAEIFYISNALDKNPRISAIIQ